MTTNAFRGYSWGGSFGQGTIRSLLPAGRAPEEAHVPRPVCKDASRPAGGRDGALGRNEWPAHKGTVGKTVLGELHILDEAMREVPTGSTGTLWFKTASPFEYFNDPIRTAEVNSPDRTMSTVGDIGRLDEDGYVYLTDRAAFMIISGGVNIYPQESRTC
jgi:acyl-CoA synthetase (AMP-forming)/AMP-acid ligase II